MIGGPDAVSKHPSYDISELHRKLAAANARVRELEARLLDIGTDHTNTLFRLKDAETVVESSGKLIAVLENQKGRLMDDLKLSKDAHEYALGQVTLGVEQYLQLRAAVQGVMPILEAAKTAVVNHYGDPLLDDEDDAAIERIRGEVGDED
jgi:hypothetical protein